MNKTTFIYHRDSCGDCMVWCILVWVILQFSAISEVHVILILESVDEILC